MGHSLAEVNEGANLWMELNTSPADDVPPPPNQAISPRSDPTKITDDEAQRRAPKRPRSEPKPRGARFLDDADPMKVLSVGVAGLLIAIAFVFVDTGTDNRADTDVGSNGTGSAALVLNPTEITLQSGPPQALALTDSNTSVSTTTPPPPQVPVALLDESQLQMLRLYRSSFGRNPDGPGFSYWADQLRAGTPLVDVAAMFGASEEFIGTTDESAEAEVELVARIYQNGTNIAPDETTAANLLAVLQDGSVADLLVAVSEAPETIEHTGTGSEMVAAMENTP